MKKSSIIITSSCSRLLLLLFAYRLQEHHHHYHHHPTSEYTRVLDVHKPARLFIRVSVNQNDDAREELSDAAINNNIEGIVINGAVYDKDNNITISGRETRSIVNECVGKWYKQLKGKVIIIIIFVVIVFEL